MEQPISLHPAVQKLSRLLVIELRNHLVEQVDELSPAPGSSCSKLLDAGSKHLQFLSVKISWIFNHPKILESCHIQGFLVSIEFLEVLFAGGVTLEEVDRILVSCLELGHTGAGLVLRGTLDGLIAPLHKIPLRNLAEGDEIQLMVKLRKEHVTVLPQKAGHEAELPGLLGGDEITANIIRGRQGLVLLQTAVKAIEQAAVGEGYVGKAGGGNRHFQDIGT